MDKFLLSVFKREVARQCAFALLAANDLQAGLNSRNSERVWFAIQALLGSAGNVSKLLWPPKAHNRSRGHALRHSLGITGSSPLEPRTFRNHFEHFDERLESWAGSSKRHNIADSNIGPEGMIAGLDLGDYLRNFDPNTYCLTFRGDSYLLHPILLELKLLHERSISPTSPNPPLNSDPAASG
jgi:hypothetical protein